MPDIVLLGDLSAADATTAGPKAAGLGELARAGVCVAPGFCLPLAVYDRIVRPVLADLMVGGDIDGSTDALRGLVEGLVLPPALLSELDEAYSVLCPDGGRVAVRSSGTFEDSAAASFAGQYRTELAVAGNELAGAIRRCWASLWEPHAIRYRVQRGIAHHDAGMAVIVQAMVEADAAGVMFTVHPVAGSDGVLIESSWGYGEAVVGGLVVPDRFRAGHADGTLLSAEISHKTTMVGRGGAVEVPAHQRDAASLTADQVAALVRQAVAIEDHYGCPQDIEWSIVDNRVVILQARPITRTGAPPPEISWPSPVEGALWARISICDSWLPEPLSPLFATTLYPVLVDRWMRNWAGGDRAVRRSPLLPKPMAGTINGYAYLRLDFRLNRHPVWTARLVIGWFRFHLSRLQSLWREEILPHHVGRIEELRAVDEAGLDDEAILARVAEVEQLSARYWAIIGGLAWYWNVGEWLLAALGPWATRSSEHYGSLLQGYPTTTYEAELALYDLARIDDPSTARSSFDDLLSRYGHQVYNLDFAEPTPAEDPVAFETTLRAYRTGEAKDPHERLRVLAHRRDTQEAALLAALRRFPIRRRVLTGLLRWNRRYAQVRDEALFAFTFGWPVMRRGYLELGRRLACTGALRTADDVFFLTDEELRAALREPARDLRELIACRRALREQQRSLRPPLKVPADARIHLGPLDITSLAVITRESTSDNEPGLRGSPASPGRVTAPARVVLSTADFGRLRPGEVLVVPQITPAWSSLLAIAGGVVTDTGGVLSHGSIVAREYGIPAVMGTTDATRQIQDGQIVTIDGDRGLVR